MDYFVAVWAVWLLFGGAALGQVFQAPFSDSPLLGPHGGTIIADLDDLYEVSIDPGTRQVDLYALSSSEGPPSNVSITLFRFEGEETVQLETVSLPWESVPHHQGRLTHFNAPFMGMEVRIWFDTGRSRVIRAPPEVPEELGAAG